MRVPRGKVGSLLLSFGLSYFCCGPLLYGQKIYLDHTQPVNIRVKDLLARLTIEEKISLLSETPPAIPRLGIARYNYGNEALHGVTKPGSATVFPQAIALAATWDPALMLRVATAISDEARAKYNEVNGAVDTRSGRGRANGLLTFFSPTINMARDPRWGRTAETYGEDPFLTSRMAVAFVHGMQGDDTHYLKVLSTPKHFVAYNVETNRFKSNANVSERALREYYFPAFKAAVVEGKAQSIMSSYNAINGIPATANHWLLTDVLRDQWGFSGFVVTDCGAVAHLFAQHKFAPDAEHAAALAINAGVDMECGSWSDTPYVFQHYLLKAKQDGLVTSDTIDRAAGNVLKIRFELGLFDAPRFVPFSNIPADTVGSAEHVELARQAARESMVLLKNDRGLLPINTSRVHSITVVGPGAAVAEFGDYSGHSPHTPVTPLDGIRARASATVHVETVPWISVPKNGESVLIPATAMRSGGGKLEEGGLKGEYFANKDLKGPSGSRIDTTVSFDWLNLPPDSMLSGDVFSVRWTGMLVPPMSGDYKVTVTSDDGVRLTIDGKVLIDAWNAKPATAPPSGNQWTPIVPKRAYTISVNLAAGHRYSLILEYRNQGGAFIRLSWQQPAAKMVDRFAQERKAARSSDLVIAMMGPGSDQGSEGTDRKDLGLPLDQQNLLHELAMINRHLVVVLVNGGPMAVPWVKQHVPAILEEWYPGEQGGSALADVLFGDFNPAGRLPLTFYRGTSQLPPFDDYEITHGRTYMYLRTPPLYPFGYGLSYTQFRYSNLRVEHALPDSGGDVCVTVDVTNAGTRAGDEVVQLYARSSAAREKRPIRELKAFQRVFIEAGQTRKVVLIVPISSFRFFDSAHHGFIVDPGDMELQVGASSEDIRLRTIIDLHKRGFH